MPITDRAGHRIHYEIYGSPEAPPVLLIMGLGLSSRAWDRLPELLAAHFRVLVFDNRGTGRSGHAGWAFHMRDLADDAAAVLDAAGAKTAHVFGISMGGMIAQELVLRHPDRVRSLVLGATFAGWLRSRKPGLRTMLDLLLLNCGFVDADRLARLMVSAEWHGRNPGGALEWIRRAERTALRFALAQMAAIARHSTATRLAQIRTKTLILTGDGDRLVPAANSLLLAKLIPGARLLVLPGAGHAFPLEREQETVQALLEHFRGAAAQAA
jgi:pimeloyl-ACP methyl ester carboxylesterase